METAVEREEIDFMHGLAGYAYFYGGRNLFGGMVKRKPAGPVHM